MTSEAYLDLGGRAERRWPPSYNEVIGVACPKNANMPPSLRGCGAMPGNLCINSATGRARKMPCRVRLVPTWARPRIDLDEPPTPGTAENRPAPVAV